MKKRNIGNFLTEAEKQNVKAAVKEAESRTSGEIRVVVVPRSRRHFSPLAPEKAVDRRAIMEFEQLGISNTEGKTGVLILISLAERMVSVKADEAISDKVPAGTWQETVQLIISGIKADSPCKGICDAIRQVGGLLLEHFPIKPDDKNELPDDVVIRKS